MFSLPKNHSRAWNRLTTCAFGAKWAATNIHMILGKSRVASGCGREAAITGSIKELSNPRRNRAAVAFGQARNAFLSAVRPLGRPFGKASLSADLAPRKASSSEPGNLVAVGNDFRSAKALAFRAGMPNTSPDTLTD